MKFLVTGAAGFIGSALCRRLVLVEGHTVVAVDKLTYAGTMTSLESVQGRAEFSFIQADICDAEAMTKVFIEHQPDAVCNLAAETHVDRSIDGAGPFIQTNVVGTHVLLQAALDYWRATGGGASAFRFLHVSTDEVYGSAALGENFKETTPYDPRSPYSASKAASDHLVSAWGHTYGLPVLISNCSNNYGPYHFPEKLIPLVILNALEGRPLPIYGDGLQVRDWLFVDDHARALSLIARAGRSGRSYNVGGGAERTNLEVVVGICDLLDALAPAADIGPRRALIRHVPDRPGHDRRYAIDASRLQHELGWQAEESFESGLRKTVEWYLANSVWWEPLRARYEGDRLGLEAKQSKSSNIMSRAKFLNSASIGTTGVEDR